LLQLRYLARDRFCMAFYSNVGVHRFTGKTYSWGP
jgi:hypothetical protein